MKRGTGIPKRMWERFEKRHRRRADGRTKALETLIGRPVPADLRVYGYSDSPAGSIFLPDVKSLVGPRVNSFETILDNTDPGMPDALRQIFSGCYYITEIEGDGDCIFAHIPPELEEPTCPVTVWAHGEGLFTDPIADDIASFELAWSVSTGEIAAKKAKPLLPDLRGRIHHRWPFNSDSFEGNALLEPYFGEPRESAIRFLGARSEWIVQIFHEGKGLPDWLLPHAQVSFSNLKDMLAHEHFPQRHATALFAMWRTFFFAEDDKLRAVLDRLEGTPSRLLADASKTARELLAGRKEIGALKDAHAVRKWLAAAVKKKPAAKKNGKKR